MPRSPVPAYTWRHQVNISVSEVDDDTMRAELLYQMKTAWIGGGSWLDSEGASASAPAGWAVDSSCDSLTAGAAGDGVDRWLDNGDLVWNTTAAARSWCVLVHANFFGAGQPLYVLLDCSEASGATANGTLGVFLAQAPFTGGTTTARPTSTDENTVLIAGGVATTNSSNWQGNVDAGDLAKQVHISMTDDGTIFRAHITEGGLCEARWDLFLVNDAPVGWSRPVLMSIMGEATNEEHNTWANAWNALSFGGRYRGYDSTLGAFLLQAGIPCYGASETPHVDFVGNSFDAAIMPAPIVLTGVGSPVAGPVCVVPDCWWVSNANGTGDHAEDDAGNLRQFCQFGEMLVVWPRVVAVVS